MVDVITGAAVWALSSYLLIAGTLRGLDLLDAVHRRKLYRQALARRERSAAIARVRRTGYAMPYPKRETTFMVFDEAMDISPEQAQRILDTFGSAFPVAADYHGTVSGRFQTAVPNLPGNGPKE